MIMNDKSLANSILDVKKMLGSRSFAVYYPANLIVGSERGCSCSPFAGFGTKNKKVSFNFFGDKSVTAATCVVESAENYDSKFAKHTSSAAKIQAAKSFVFGYYAKVEYELKLRLKRIYFSADGYLLTLGRESKSKVHFVDMMLFLSETPTVEYSFNGYYIDFK